MWWAPMESPSGGAAKKEQRVPRERSQDLEPAAPNTRAKVLSLEGLTILDIWLFQIGGPDDVVDLPGVIHEVRSSTDWRETGERSIGKAGAFSLPVLANPLGCAFAVPRRE
jgi:hypothetical protein